MTAKDSLINALSDWVAHVEMEVGSRRPTAMPAWQRPDWYESSVQLALNHITKPGDLAFDVGANIGMISGRLGQLVGPFGRVVGFEASPRVLPLLHTNINASNAFNVTIVNAAVADTSGAILEIHYGADHVADSVMSSDPGAAGHPVRTIALDDYVRSIGRMPDVIKMDIEGAEHLAMRGAVNILREGRPPLVIEFSSADAAFVDWMAEQGYAIVIDLSTLAPFSIDPRAHLVNGLFLHADNPRGHAFRSVEKTLLVDLPVDGGTDVSLDIGFLDAGSYMLAIEFADEALSINETMRVALFANQDQRLLSIADTSHLAAAYTHMPFWIDMPGQGRLEINCPAAAAAPVATRIKLLRLVFPDR